ncbi:MAG: hypothetical protein AVDCRST_MAG36-440 [uncultured Nocardioidaceae bacterium]|uniref:GP-PDE domain-containing protein n=1 Tax=uncultured Nocardioidaceae bacterium TaxID=253824 RepID=A0A6J4L5K1_9ACTN|nr:MAG: hypothetical protein AVDCRST_MAG36-440 [uncultured Nocardioidaceae bacterium]
MTNEDTVAALRDVARGAPGAWCEIDTWRLSDGTMIVFHDPTWGRVANHTTLPAGVTPSSLVTNATWAQVSQIRTKGGEPIPTLKQMIDASATYKVPLTVEVKNSVTNPAGIVGYAKTKGATVDYYRKPGFGCAVKVLDPLRAAGARIGLKLIKYSDCTLADIKARGTSFITTLNSKVTPKYVQDMKTIGVEIYVRDVTESTSQGTLANGAARLMVEDPRAALAWPGV